MISINVDADSPIPLYRQVYDGLRTLILNGTLPPGHSIPSTRQLAEMLSISRTTASVAYELLESEGYIDTTPASRTFVKLELPDNFLRSAGEGIARNRKLENSNSIQKLSRLSERLDIPMVETPGRTKNKQGLLLDVSSNNPSLPDFPFNLWKKILSNLVVPEETELLDYCSFNGCSRFRMALARYLQLSRSVKCDWNQVIVCAGSRQALDLIARLHIDEGDIVAIEEPGYPTALGAFKTAGAVIRPLAVDQDGLDPQAISRFEQPAKLLYTTPSHQYPLGATMPLSRRIELLRLSSEMGTLIIEDDYDSEFRYSGRPLSSLQGMHYSESVIYMGTLSKVMYPSLRLAYIVVPPGMSEIYRRAQMTLFGDPPTLLQEATAIFMESGSLERHIRRMRIKYSERRDLAISEFNKRFGAKLDILGDASGLHFIVRFSKNVKSKKFLNSCMESGFIVKSTERFYLNDPRPNEYAFGFGHLSESQIRQSIKAMAKAYEQAI